MNEFLFLKEFEHGKDDIWMIVNRSEYVLGIAHASRRDGCYKATLRNGFSESFNNKEDILPWATALYYYGFLDKEINNEQ